MIKPTITLHYLHLNNHRLHNTHANNTNNTYWRLETMINGEYNPIKLAKVINCLSQEKCREIAVIMKRDMIIRMVEVNEGDISKF